LLATLQQSVNSALIEWLDALPGYYEVGDYFFTHAGIRPGIALDQQDASDLLWTRSPFLESRLDHGKVIVHGNSIETGQVKLGRNRIGLDSDEHSVLTALDLQDGEQRLIPAGTALL
jgi:serine/threonine protein phosphatase 1